MFPKEGKGKANNKPEKVRKHVDPFDVYGSPFQQAKQPIPPSNDYTVTLLKFIYSNVFTYYSCGGKFFHQVYSDALRDLILVLKTNCVIIK